MIDNQLYKTIVIGTSAGGFKALKTIITELPQSFCLPIIIVQHLSPQSDGFMAQYFNQISHLQVKEADSGEPIRPNHVYIAPANYHLLIEKDETLSLTVDEKVNYARPSIDVMFESAAMTFQNRLVAIILTGANDDGTKGICTIKRLGGLTIAQSPETAEVGVMPKAAIEAGCVDLILGLEEIAKLLSTLCHRPKGSIQDQ
ncbi:MAG: chemotaxis protein CheB [Bacteroidetes bacterium HGW-Bacteroidetes-1]|jgi:two-component system chemotaxis response regulator CheB|nr:MAG: chemotaxis protein CheB [Bacteroidetes bacterium HGW-Bacteroidetes-1]